MGKTARRQAPVTNAVPETWAAVEAVMVAAAAATGAVAAGMAVRGAA